MDNEYLIYLRKSRKDNLSGLSDTDILNRHKTTLLTYAKQHQLSVGAIYQEIVSGDSIHSRPQMQRLLSEVERKQWKGVLVMEIERLARGDTVDQGIVQRTFQYSNTLIITPAKTYDPSNEFDEEYFEFGLFMSRREYKTIKRRLLLGKYAAAREGKWPFNTTPLGYDRVKLLHEKGWALQINEKEAPLIRLIFSLFTAEDRMGLTDIARYLNAHGFTTRTGKNWTPSRVREILTNPVYDQKIAIGRRKIKVNIIEGIPVKSRPRSDDFSVYNGLHSRIIPSSVFSKAQEFFK